MESAFLYSQIGTKEAMRNGSDDIVTGPSGTVAGADHLREPHIVLGRTSFILMNKSIFVLSKADPEASEEITLEMNARPSRTEDGDCHKRGSLRDILIASVWCEKRPRRQSQL